MTMSAHSATVELWIPSEPGAIGKLQERFVREVTQCRYQGDVGFALVLAFAEALANAHHHGNREDQDKRIWVRYDLAAERAEIEITDEGSGFDPGEVADPRTSTNLERSHGRGLLLMRELFDEVRFSREGQRIRLIKRTRQCRMRDAAA
jgi:anti-sigma regulatory factor (Ser/Thr protein kinase)